MSSRPVTRPAVNSKVTPIRRKSSQAASGGMEVCVIKPTKVEDYREIADTLLSGCTVVLNLEGNDVDDAQRIIDLSSGSCYAIGGGLQKVSSYIFILTPSNVEISGDIQDLLNGAVPSMRTSF
jgi:cell division inhibitor SepF